MVLADDTTTTFAAPRRAAPGRAAPAAAAPPDLRFTWVALLLAAWPVIGGHVDGWAHKHLALETFFTPWHALLYSGLLANAAVLGWRLLAGRRAGLPWSRALPAGYGLSLAGCALFAAGGALDLGWHLAFGIERRFAANVSPTHLLLMVSVGLIAGGPLRAAWRRGGRLGLPGLLSATMVLSTLTFFGQFDQPYTDQWVAAPAPPVAPDLAQQQGVLGIIVFTAMLLGVVLPLLARFELAFGSLALLGLNAVFVTAMEHLDPIVLVAAVAGLVGDVLLARLRPSPARRWALRAFAFLLPAVLFGLYDLAIGLVDGLAWPAHVWAGSIVVAGLAGAALSLLLVPAAAAPARPA